MAETFNEALLWHMERFGPTIAELARGSGVSPEAIKQMRARKRSGASAANGSKIAAYYGKTLEQFMRCEESTGDEETFIALFGLLSPEEKAILLRQVRGMIAVRD